MRPFAIAIVLFLGTALFAGMGVVAQTIPDLNGDVRNVSGLASQTPSSIATTENGKILVAWAHDNAPTTPTSNPCHLSISTDEGVTWGPSKYVGVDVTPTNGQCTAEWIDEDSLIVAGSNVVRVSHDNGLTFATVNPPSPYGTGVPGGQSRPEITIIDANNWAVYDGYHMAFTSNAGTAWTVRTLTALGSNCCVDMIGSPVTGDWIALTRGPSPTVFCTLDNFLTAQPGSTTNYGTFGTIENQGSLVEIMGGVGTTGLYSAGNSFDGINQDVGIFITKDCGASWEALRIYVASSDPYVSGSIGRIAQAENNAVYVTVKGSATSKTYIIKTQTVNPTTALINQAVIEDLTSLSAFFQTTDWASFDNRIYGLFEESNLAKIIVADDIGNAAVSSQQIAVTNLLGASMDATGRSILTRENPIGLSTTINVYSGLNLANGAVATATSDCSQLDGVLSTTLNDEIYNVYLDCDGTGLTDTIRIRNVALEDPNFSNPDCSETDADVSEDDFGEFGNVPFPPNMQQIGTMNDLSIAYNKCDNSGTNHAAASITFSTTGTLAQGGGRIGVFGWVFNNFGLDNTDSASVQLDTNGNPFVDQFCSYQDFTGSGHDFVGGVSRQGPTGLYHGTNSVSGTGAEQVEVDLEQVYLNANPYGQAKGIDCVNGDAVILQEDRFVRISNAFIPGGTKTFITQAIDGETKVRGIAMSRLYQFTAWTDGPDIKIGWLDPAISNTTYTQTASFPIPPGQFRGMEFTEQAEFLAVYTSDFITVFNTAPVTCELLTCDNDAGGDDGGTTCTINCEGPDPTPDPDDPDSPRGIAGLNRTNSIWASMATIAIFALLALMTVRRRQE